MIAGIILCAGLGTRLRPLTELIPKPAIPFMGRPIAAYALSALIDAGIKRVAINVHHLPERMESALGDAAEMLGFTGPIGVYRESYEILGTAGGARAAASTITPAQRYVIYHGDVVCGAAVDQAIEDHIDSNAMLTMVVAKRPDNCELGRIGVDDSGRVIQIRDWTHKDQIEAAKTKPAVGHPYLFTGIHIVEAALLKRIPKKGYACLVTDIYREMLEMGETIHAHETSSYFADLGTPEEYHAAQALLLAQPELLKGVVKHGPKAPTYHDMPPLQILKF